MDLVAAQELAGARVLRPIGPGQRAAVLLGHVADEGEGHAVVLKHVTGDDAAERAGRELAALERAAGEHVVRVLDTATAPDGYILTLERLAGEPLETLLARRSGWAAGEAVTLLAPLAETLRRMHAAGVAHGAVTASHVVLTASGSPTLVGFGTAELFPAGSPEAVRAAIPAVVRDREGLRSLALGVIGQVTGERRRSALALAEELAQLDAELVLERCATGLFDLAAPQPIGSGDSVLPAPSGLRLPRAAAPVPSGLRGTVSAGGAWGLLAGVVPDSWVKAVQELPGRELLQGLRERLRGLLAGRRRLVLAGAGLALATVVALLVVIPPEGATGEMTSTGSTTSPVGAREPAGIATSVTGADPVAAAGELLVARELCFRELSALCLEAVDQHGSVALERDRTAIRAAQAGGNLDPAALIVDAGAPLVLVEELGGSAIVRAGPGAEAPSLLLIHGEDGWRIREVIPAAG